MSLDKSNLFNLLDNTPIGVVIHKANGDIAYANPTALSMLNVNLHQLIEKQIYQYCGEFIDSQYNVIPHEALPVYRVMRNGNSLKNQVVGIIDPQDSKVRWFSVDAYPESQGDGVDNTSFIVVYFFDITQKIREFSFKDIVHHAQDMIIVTEANEIDAPFAPKIIYVNEALCKHSEYAIHELIGETPRIFQGPLTDKNATARIRQALKTHTPCTETLLNYTKSGAPFWVQMNIFPLKNGFGEVTHFAAVQRNISEMKFQTEQLDKRNAELKRIKSDLEAMVNHRTRELRSANLKLEKLAYFDSLTNIPNRRAFLETFEKNLCYASRHKHSVLVGIADIDHFKSINDTFGHGFGDEVIVNVARTMKHFFRLEDNIGRIGGEEFAFSMLLSETTDPSPLLNRLREKISVMHESISSLKNTRTTLSIGAVHVLVAPALSTKELLSNADKALYEAKNKGRNCVVCHRKDALSLTCENHAASKQVS